MNLLKKAMDVFFGRNNTGTVYINGVSYQGNSVCIIGDKVFVDGTVSSGSLVGNLVVTVNGSCESVATASGDINVKGEVKGNLKSASGDISCGNVLGSVFSTSGDIECQNIGGCVNTVSGDISR